ncbi:MAG: enoyl-CoA hydratase [Alphaproteobacteria bacterium]|nr:enoyl-CoA hydratase [Alphaproteobacteria bacterium]
MTATSEAKINEPILLREDAHGVATLTLNRPGARNALSRDMIGTMQAELDAIRDDKSVRVVVIAATGPAFCAGHDMKELRANPTQEYFDATFKASSTMMMSMIRLPQPVIARVQGTATAAGLQMVATCDLAVASSEATFATPGVNIGLFCSTPMVPLTRNVGRKAAMEMLLLGNDVPAERAEELGIVNRVVAPDALDHAVAEITAKITSMSPLTCAIGKEAFYRQLDMDIEAAYAYAADVMARNMMARDAEEGLDAFLEKRRPVWRGE